MEENYALDLPNNEIIKVIQDKIKIENKKLKKHIVIVLFLLILYLPSCIRSLKDVVPKTMDLYRNNSSITLANIDKLYHGRHFSRYANFSFTTSRNEIFKEKERLSHKYFNFLDENNIKQVYVIYINSKPKKSTIIREDELQNKELLFKRIEKDEKSPIKIGIGILLFLCFGIIFQPLSKILEFKRHKTILSLNYRTDAEVYRIDNNSGMFKLVEKDKKYSIFYQFIFKDKKYKGIYNCKELNNIKIGSILRVLFNPSKPRFNFNVDRYTKLNI